MKVLIAGASGALGVPLTRALLSAGHEVIGLSRTPGNREKLRALGAEPLIADVMDRRALLAAVDGLKADAVVHALTALKKTPIRHRDMAATNALREVGTANLLAAARAVGARRFLVESMIFGYGYGDWGTKVLTEDDPPFGPPGQSRWLERHIRAMRSAESQTIAAEGIEGIALRYGLLYGPGAGAKEMVEMLRRRRLPVLRDGGGPLSWIYIEDAATATAAALENGRPGQAYNVVDDEPTSWREFMRAMAEAVGAPPPLAVPRWVLRLAPYAYAALTSTMRISNDKARRELGWAPSYPTYRQGIEKVTESLRGEPPVAA
jgi:nucleoside-diphosphate-sugar epimerase